MSTPGFALPSVGMAELQEVTMLGIDDALLPFKRDLCLTMTKPSVRAEPVLGPSPFESNAPDNLAAHFYGTVLADGAGFRMWYYACHYGKNPDWPPAMMQQVAKSPGWFRGDCPLFQGPLCYAESVDGIVWTKPALGQVAFKGSSANNALALPHTVVSGATVIKDDTDPDPSRRYKMVYQFFPDQSVPVIEEYGTMPTIALAVSPDGLRWTPTGIPYRGRFVEHSSFIKHAGRYIVHYQVAGGMGWFSEGGADAGRTGVARMSYDFDTWPDVVAEAFSLPEPQDLRERGAGKPYDQVHLGVGAASFGNVCIGLYGLWHNADNSRAFDKISCDFGLLVSSDGLHFREPVKGYRFMRREDSPATPVPGHSFNTILCQSNGILNVGDETRIYHGRWRNVGGHEVDDALRYYSAEVALATIPRDRWGALGLVPGASDGAVWTAPIVLPEGPISVSLNADGVTGMCVDVLDEQGRDIAGFSGAVCGKAQRDGLAADVKWAYGNLSRLGGETIRFGVRMERGVGIPEPRLFGIYLKRAEA